MKHHKFSFPYEEEITPVHDAPQQEPGSLDCGLFVLYIIRQYFKQQQVVKDIADVEVKNMRTEVVQAILHKGE